MQNAKNDAKCYCYHWGIRYENPYFSRLKKNFPNGMPIALYSGMENGRKKIEKILLTIQDSMVYFRYRKQTFTLENRKMDLEIVTVYVSDCCGAYLDDAHVQHGICHECGEHCEIVTEEYPATPVCGG